MNPTPALAKNRIVYLDILRGLAVLFIFVANVYTFSGWVVLPEADKALYNGAALNTVLQALTVVFVDGKWYSVFSLLFGVGFVLQYESARRAGRPFVPFFTRRMLVLLLFGCVHLFLLWLGDILSLYALLGLVLLLFRNVSDRALLIWAAVLTLFPVVHQETMYALDAVYPLALFEQLDDYQAYVGVPFTRTAAGDLDFLAFAHTWLDGENWRQLLLINVGNSLIRVGNLLLEGRPFKVLACFLLGVWAGRHILQHDLLQDRRRLKKIARFGLLLGIPMNLLLLYAKGQSDPPWFVIQQVSYALGVIPLACAYAALLALLPYERYRSLRWFAPVGRMALSNYLLQTLLSIGIFYGVGGGLAFDVPLWLAMLIVLPVFAGQMIFSHWWLRRFRFGPLEWLWRMLAYGRSIANRRNEAGQRE